MGSLVAKTLPSQANLVIYQGDDYAAVVTVVGSQGAAVDLTGYTAEAQMRLGPADAYPVVIVEIITAVTPPNTINLSIPHSITCQLSGLYVWDLQLIAPDGTISTILAGTVQVMLEVTREPGDDVKHSRSIPKGIVTRWQPLAPVYRR